MRSGISTFASTLAIRMYCAGPAFPAATVAFPAATVPFPAATVPVLRPSAPHSGGMNATSMASAAPQAAHVHLDMPTSSAKAAPVPVIVPASSVPAAVAAATQGAASATATAGLLHAKCAGSDGEAGSAMHEGADVSLADQEGVRAKRARQPNPKYAMDG